MIAVGARAIGGAAAHPEGDPGEQESHRIDQHGGRRRPAARAIPEITPPMTSTTMKPPVSSSAQKMRRALPPCPAPTCVWLCMSRPGIMAEPRPRDNPPPRRETGPDLPGLSHASPLEFAGANYHIWNHSKKKARLNMPRTLHRTKIDIPDNLRAATIDLLNARLADAVDLSSQMKQAHWNVKGPGFIALHELFDSRPRRRGGPMSTTWRSGSRRWAAPRAARPGVAASRLGAARISPGDSGGRRSRWRQRARRSPLFGKGVRRAIAEAAEIGDADTEDLFVGVSAATSTRICGWWKRTPRPKADGSAGPGGYRETEDRRAMRVLAARPALAAGRVRRLRRAALRSADRDGVLADHAGDVGGEPGRRRALRPAARARLPRAVAAGLPEIGVVGGCRPRRAHGGGRALRRLARARRHRRRRGRAEPARLGRVVARAAYRLAGGCGLVPGLRQRLARLPQAPRERGIV